MGLFFLTDRLELLGFGCEIRARPGRIRLKRGHDWSLRSTTAVSVESFGMRHRSGVFQLCHFFPGSVALIVSQDGEMKLATKRQEEVVSWDIAPLGVFLE